MIMRKLLIVALVSTAFQVPAYAAVGDDTCHRFFDNIRSRAEAVMHDHKHSFDERYATLQSLFNEAVDAQWIARFVAGPYWHAASDKERTEFVAAYRQYLADH